MVGLLLWEVWKVGVQHIWLFSKESWISCGDLNLEGC